MASFTFMVCTEPYKYQAIDTMLNMGKAILEKGHEIKGIFFFGSGLYNMISPGKLSCGTGTRNIPGKIEAFTLENRIPVAGCSTWVGLTGIKEEDMIQGGKEEGLGDLSNWVAESDKFIVFGTGG